MTSSHSLFVHFHAVFFSELKSPIGLGIRSLEKSTLEVGRRRLKLFLIPKSLEKPEINSLEMAFLDIVVLKHKYLIE